MLKQKEIYDKTLENVYGGVWYRTNSTEKTGVAKYAVNDLVLVVQNEDALKQDLLCGYIVQILSVINKGDGSFSYSVIRTGGTSYTFYKSDSNDYQLPYYQIFEVPESLIVYKC